MTAPAATEIDAIIAALPDWRGATLARVRALIHEAVPDITEDIKWRKPTNPSSGETAPGSFRSCRGHDRPDNGVPCWSHNGKLICTGETYKDKVKLTFANGAALDDPTGLFNASLDAGTRRAMDLREGAEINEPAFRHLLQAAIAYKLGAKNRSSRR